MDDLERIGTIKYEEFFRDFLEPNQPCVFSSEVTEHWRSRQEWIIDQRPHFEFLSKEFGDAVAPVANCHQTKYSSQVKQDMYVKEFCDYWRTRSEDDKECTETLYLKDWHFCKAFSSYKAYETPMYFKSDWLNEFWDQRSDVSDDYRFVYMGPKGSWTPFHADVFRSHSWSANICGCKRWLIYPPGQEKYLTDRLGNLTDDVTSEELTDQRKFPNFSKASKPITVIQREGEIIFVPSGWHHQVMNLEDTISINHNWTNACGIFKMWEHLKSELAKVQRSIEDCKDMDNWYQHCQVILRASCGINYAEFINFLDVIAMRRIRTFTENTFTDSITAEKQNGQKSSVVKTELESLVFKDWQKAMDNLEGQEGRTFKDYCRYDLEKIKECLVNIQDDQTFGELESEDLQLRLGKLLHGVDAALEKD